MSDFSDWLIDFQSCYPELAEHLPADLSPLSEIAAKASTQAEFTLSTAAYIARVVPETRIDRGREMAVAHHALLDHLQGVYGVPTEVILAIWGVETDFGRLRGDIAVIPALATLAHTSPRAAYFESELVAALELVATGRVRPDFTGSWAGASGHCQFMPSAVHDYARKTQGEALDIWSDSPIGGLTAIANYLAAHGWEANHPWLTEVPPDRPETLLIPAGLPGPAFRTAPNFGVLLCYNRATLYALGVSLLAHAIAGRTIPENWPDRPPLGRSELTKLQISLTEMGYSTKGTDGLFGPETRAAIRAYQIANDLAADGFPSKELLIHLG